MVDSMNNLKLKLSDLNKLSQDHTDSPRITRKPSDRKLQLIAIDEHGEVTIDYSCGIRIEELLFDERRSVQFIKDFETTKPEAIKFLSQPQQLKEIVDCVLEDVERYLTPPKPQAAPVQPRPTLRYTRSRDRMVLRKEGSYDNLLSGSPTRFSLTSRESLQSLTLANTTTRPLSLSSDSIPMDKKKKKRHNSNEELSSEERKRKRKEFNPDGSPKEKEKKKSDKRRSTGEKEKRKKDKDKLKHLEPITSEESKTSSDGSNSQESSEESSGESSARKNMNDKLVPIPEGNQDTEKLSSSSENITPPNQTQAIPIVELSATPQTINNGKEGIPRLTHSLSSPALLEDISHHRQTTPRLPDEIEEMPGTNKDKDANGEEENPLQKKTPVVDVSLFKDEGYRRQSLINFGSWVLTTPTLVIEALIDNEECLEILLGGLNSITENMFDTTPTKGREWFKVMHFLFCKYEKGPKLVEYLENPDHASKTKNIAFGLVNKIANGNVFRIFWEMMVGETLVNWSNKLEEDPFKLSETILEKIQAICNVEYTYKADLELMNITELVTQVIKRNAQSPMSTKFQSAPFIRPLIELSFADLPSPVIAHIISIITVILELSVNSDSKYNSRRFPPAILTFLESPTKPLLKLKQLVALDSALRHKPSTRLRRADPAQTAEQEQLVLNQFWGHSLIDSPFMSIKSLSIKSLELLNALLLSNFEAVHKQMDADEIFDLALKAFFDQPLNSVLHHNVINMISNLFYCDNYDITIGFVTRSGLLDRICDELQPDENDKERYIKASYMHFLIHLADKLNRVASMITPLNDVLEAHPRWKEVFATRIEPYLEEMSKKICK